MSTLTIERRLQQKALCLLHMRQFFREQGFLEVETPVAIRAPAPEAYIEAPEITLRLALGKSQQRFLQTSPELAMKRLLAEGLPKIYQLATVFRDGDDGPWHIPEFQLLEWYRFSPTASQGAFRSNWQTVLEDTERLIKYLAEILGLQRLQHAGKMYDLSLGSWPRLGVESLFMDILKFSPLEYLESSHFYQKLRALGVHCQSSDDWDELFHRAWLSVIEPHLLRCYKTPVWVYDFPAPMAALARLRLEDPRIAERCELYIGRLELCNGFSELLDPQEQRQRFMQAQQQRCRSHAAIYPVDEVFFEALAKLQHQGEAAGMALGWQRLLAVLLQVETIHDVAAIAWHGI